MLDMLTPMPAPAPDERIARAARLIGMYNLAIETEEEYGELTGRFSDWLAPKRQLQACIAQLQRLADLLQGRAVEQE